MGRILVHDFHHFSHSSSLGRTRPNRRTNLSPLRWVLQMKDPNTHLATVLYIHSMKKQIEKEVEAKYLKRIEYLVNANNELMNELEQCESELVTVEKECYGRGV